MVFGNYKDFFQLSLMPIGKKDQSILNERNMNLLLFSEQPTHWLVALEGECLKKAGDFYHWKVSIYPSNSEGFFDWEQVYYCSQAINSFNQAVELARTITSYIMKDELRISGLHKRIS